MGQPGSPRRDAPEAELGAEDGLALQAGALADEQVVVVALHQRLLVHVEDLRAQVQRHAGTTENAGERLDFLSP